MTSQTVPAASGPVLRTDATPAAEEAFVSVLQRAVTTLLDWQERASQRRQLSALEPHLFKDIGVDPADASREAAKPFWRA